MYLTCILNGFSAIAIFASSLGLYIGSLNGAYHLHNYLLKNVLRVPCNTFYDVTPVGRILNRFSKDLDVMDNVLPMTIRGWTACFFAVITTNYIYSFECTTKAVIFKFSSYGFRLLSRLLLISCRACCKFSCSTNPRYLVFSFVMSYLVQELCQWTLIGSTSF